MKKIIYFIVLSLACIFAGCKKESKQAIDPCSTANVTYSNFISGLLQSYGCTGCHNNQSAPNGINWEGYANSKTSALGGRVMGAITHAPGYSPMPKTGGKLTDCEINKVKAWIDAGAPQ
jgi:hypothetical protein